MKTEKQIREMLKEMEEYRIHYVISKRPRYAYYISREMKALEWVLEHD
jgi:hypothetical protein